jgi:hypothetical protein
VTAAAGRCAQLLTSTCTDLDIDPFACHREILHWLPAQSSDRLDELLPDAWYALDLSERKTAT